MMAYGVETRVPFLDTEFVKLIMEDISPLFKMCDYNKMRVIEKYILRKAFDTPEDPFLPNEVLWRQKEQFQDGVGYGWVDGIKDHANKRISDYEYELRSKIYPYNTPMTKEDYLYRQMFESL